MKIHPLIFILIILIGFNCRKKNETESCGCNSPKTESVEKIFGILIDTDDGPEILTDEKGLLTPCSKLPANFAVGSPVTVSGTLKVPCKKILYDHSIIPIQISELKLRNSNYDKTDITLTIIKSEDSGYPPGYGYFIQDHRPGGIKISQPIIPAIPGLNPFKTPDEATKTGILVISLLRKNSNQLPSLSLEILKHINVI